MKKVFKIVGGIVAFTAMVAGLGAVVMLLWNWIIPSVIGWQTITYWQAFGLFALCKLLFGSFRFGDNGFHRKHEKHFSHIHEKWGKMTKDERREYIKKVHSQQFGHNYWNSETAEKQGESGKNEQ